MDPDYQMLSIEKKRITKTVVSYTYSRQRGFGYYSKYVMVLRIQIHPNYSLHYHCPRYYRNFLGDKKAKWEEIIVRSIVRLIFVKWSERMVGYFYEPLTTKKKVKFYLWKSGIQNLYLVSKTLFKASGSVGYVPIRSK